MCTLVWISCNLISTSRSAIWSTTSGWFFNFFFMQAICAWNPPVLSRLGMDNLLPSWIASYVIDLLILEQVLEIRFWGMCDCVVGTAACYRWKGEARGIKAIHMARCVNLSSTSTMRLTMFSIPLVPGYFLALCLYFYVQINHLILNLSWFILITCNRVFFFWPHITEEDVKSNNNLDCSRFRV